jgi:hypothetical protein
MQADLFKWNKQMNFLKGSVVFAFLLGIGISTIFGVKNLVNAQTQVSEPIIGQMPPTTKSPIGNNVGLEELTALHTQWASFFACKRSQISI